MFEMENTAQRSNAEDGGGVDFFVVGFIFFPPNPPPSTNHHYPLGCSGAGTSVKELLPRFIPPTGISPLLLLGDIIQPLWSTSWGRCREEQGGRGGAGDVC